MPILTRSAVALIALGIATNVVAQSQVLDPAFQEVEAAVRQHFASAASRKPGDLVKRSDAEQVFKVLAGLGWQPKEQPQIVDRFLADGSFLVRKLGTKRGTAFMRHVAKLPNGYDRLDRLSAISGGRKIISDLVKQKGGYELIQYLTTSQGGRNMGTQLERVPGGRNFNKPTGKIYTVDGFIQALRLAYEADPPVREKDS